MLFFFQAVQGGGRRDIMLGDRATGRETGRYIHSVSQGDRKTGDEIDRKEMEWR